MCCKQMTWIERFIGWIIRVFQGWWNWAFKKPDKETLRRRAICADCKYRKGKICGVCFCPIISKSASPNEKCLKDLW